MAKIEMGVSEVRNLCIKNNWFTNGDNKQYSAMFDRVNDGADIEEIATIIWICSVDADKDDIIRQLSPKPVSKERITVVRAMETLARAVNDESVFMHWLSMGVADGDIREDTTDEELEWYAEDENFAELMETFLELMSGAKKSGGLHVDGIVSK